MDDSEVLGSELTPADKFEGELPQQKISAARSLADLAKDLALFTPGPFFTHAGLDRDPVQEWTNEVEGDPIVTVLTLPEPIFDRMTFPDGRTDWNFKVLGVERKRWTELLHFLAGVAISDTRKGTFYHSFPHTVPVPDRLALMRQDVAPLVQISVFGLSGNKRRVYALPGLTEQSVARVVIRDPDPAIVAKCKNMFPKGKRK